MAKTRITEAQALDAFYASQRGNLADPGSVQLGYLLAELQMHEANAGQAKVKLAAAIDREAKSAALEGYANALYGLVAELRHDLIPGVQAEHGLTLVNDKRLKIGVEVERLPKGSAFVAPFGKIVAYIPGGYEVRWEGVSRGSAGALTYENDETIALRYPEEI